MNQASVWQVVTGAAKGFLVGGDAARGHQWLPGTVAAAGTKRETAPLGAEARIKMAAVEVESTGWVSGMLRTEPPDGVGMGMLTTGNFPRGTVPWLSHPKLPVLPGSPSLAGPGEKG